MSGWHVSVDRGGTFLDVVARRGDVERAGKLLADPGRELDGVREFLGGEVESLRLGTTVATNALLTRSGVRVGLLLTRGLEDLPFIGHQARPDIFALRPQREPPVAVAVESVPGRLAADGEEVEPLDREATAQALARLLDAGVDVVAVVGLHGVSYPRHELTLSSWLAEAGVSHVLSHQVLPRLGYVDRIEATSVDAHLTPVLLDFVSRVNEALASPSSLYMTSAGGLVSGDTFRGRDALLSGPAGGVAGCARVARELGLDAVLGFDMGGTSTDVCRWAGTLERRETTEIAGRSVPLPGLDIVSVAAGGGSVLTVRDGRALVGPESAGATPGPASYGCGGPATVSDANVVLGRLQPRWTPAVFGPDGDRPLDASAARAALAADHVDPREAAWGFLRVANEAMAEAIGALSAQRGHDPREHALVAFGGAGPQHGCAVAALLGIDEVIVHPRAGVLSAWGIAGAARLTRLTRAVQRPWTDRLPDQQAEAIRDLSAAAEGEIGEPCTTSVSWSFRYKGAEAVLEAADRASFELAHERLFGFARPAASVRVEALHVEARRETPVDRLPKPPADPTPPPVEEKVDLVVGDGPLWKEVRAPVVRVDSLGPGQSLLGPALVVGSDTTVVVEPGWTLRVGEGGALRLRRDRFEVPRPTSTVPASPDPVGLALYGRRLMGIATAMGETLRRVAWSINIRERLDFSCAVFDAEGRLLANAPHIPVHLGAMGETVRALRDSLPSGQLRPGRAWAVNDPRRGGSHLPDITVITPVFAPGEPSPFGWVASRGHHADVGGTTPGSMPPFSVTLEEEGVLLRELLLLDDGRFLEAEVRAVLASGAHPARRPDTVVADLQAQLAANQLGAERLNELRRRVGSDVLRTWMGFVLDHGDAILKRWVADTLHGPVSFQDAMDDGTEVIVRLAPEGDGLLVDLTGTGPAGAHNLNVPPAVVRAATLYVLRCCLERDVPLNEGVLRSVRFVLPTGSLVDPPPGAAVVGGNVETSQRLVDVLLGALGVAAASQGTMNNLCFGDEGAGYYETICGGAGATPTGPGTACIHTHMTNTRITDPEVLETRAPVRVERFGRRLGSGGAGRHPGGDGVVRELRFLRDQTASLLAQRRTRAPFGLAGGGEGAPGSATLVRDGDELPLEPCFVRDLRAGDLLRIHTPGGGGWGPAEEDAEDL